MEEAFKITEPVTATVASTLAPPVPLKLTAGTEV